MAKKLDVIVSLGLFLLVALVVFNFPNLPGKLPTMRVNTNDRVTFNLWWILTSRSHFLCRAILTLIWLTWFSVVARWTSTSNSVSANVVAVDEGVLRTCCVLRFALMIRSTSLLSKWSCRISRKHTLLKSSDKRKYERGYGIEMPLLYMMTYVEWCIVWISWHWR